MLHLSRSSLILGVLLASQYWTGAEALIGGPGGPGIAPVTDFTCETESATFTYNNLDFQDLNIQDDDYLVINKDPVVTSADLLLVDSNCKRNGSSASSATQTLTFGFNECNPETLTDDDGNLFIIWTVRKYESELVLYHDDCIKLNCSVSTGQIVSTSFNASLQKVLLEELTEDTSVVVTLKVYNSNASRFDDNATSLVFSVPNPVFVRAAIDGASVPATYLVRIQDCIASSDNDKNSAPTVEIITNFTRNEDPDMGVIIGDTEAKYTDFQFNSFIWADPSNGNSVYLFCTVVVCDSSLPGDCFLPGEGGRRRRREVSSENLRNLILGPIMMITSKVGPP